MLSKFNKQTFVIILIHAVPWVPRRPQKKNPFVSQLFGTTRHISVLSVTPSHLRDLSSRKIVNYAMRSMCTQANLDVNVNEVHFSLDTGRSLDLAHHWCARTVDIAPWLSADCRSARGGLRRHFIASHSGCGSQRREDCAAQIGWDYLWVLERPKQ